MVAALVEASVRKPRVKDLNRQVMISCASKGGSQITIHALLIFMTTSIFAS